VRGRLTEAESKRRLSGATITLIDYNKQAVLRATTDSTGSFQIKAPRAGGFQLRFDLLGHTTLISERIELRTRETVQLAVQLSTQAVALPPLVIAAGQQNRGNLEEFEKRRTRPGSRYFVSQKEIDRRTAVPASNLVVGVGGATIMPGAREDSHVIMLPGDLGQCRANVYVDGTLLRAESVDEWLLSGWVGGVEVYPRAALVPAELQRVDNTCGAVLFWTRAGESEGGLSWKKIAAAAGLLFYAGAMVAGMK
jgi:hypothetical protein